MPKTEVRGGQVKDSTIQRDDLDVATVGQSVVRKILAGSGVELTADGADAGTGDVTVKYVGPNDIPMSYPDTLVVQAGTARWYAPVNLTITAVRASVGTAPTGASAIFDVNKNGTTIFTTQSNRPTIAASSFTDLADAIDVTTLSAGDYLTVDIDQIGSTVPGADATIQISWKPT